MKKLLFIIILVLVTLSSVYCQKCKPRFADRTNGYIITMNLDTIYGYIIWKNDVTNQDFVKFYDSIGCKHKYTVDSLDGYKYKDLSFTQCYYNDKKIWLKLRANGHIKVFEYCYWELIWVPISFFPYFIMFPKVSIKYLMQIGDNTIRDLCVYDCINEFKLLFRANKTLAEEIGERKFSIRDIIKEYNQWYEQHKDSLVRSQENNIESFIKSEQYCEWYNQNQDSITQTRKDKINLFLNPDNYDKAGKFIEKQNISSYIRELTILKDTAYFIVRSELQISEKDSSFEAYYRRVVKIFNKSPVINNPNIIRSFTTKGYLKEIGYQALVNDETGKTRIIKVGVWHYFNKNGGVWRVESYDLQGENDGIWSEFDIEGTKYKEIIYKDGKKQQVIKY